MRLSSRSGFGLLLLVMIIAILGILFIASEHVLQQAARQTQLRIDQTKAHYLAQAGVTKAVWDWYTSNTATDTSRRWAPINTTVTGNMLFKAGTTSAGVYSQSNYAYYTSVSDTSALPALVKTIATNISTTAGTSIAVTVPAAGVAAGNYVIVSLAMDANRSGPACVDTKGNTYTSLQEAAATSSTSDARLALFSAPVAIALVNTNTITCSWTSNCTAKAMVADEYTRVSGVDTSISASNAAGTAANSGAISTSFGSEMLVAAVATEGPSTDSYTVGSGYTNTPPTRVGTTALAGLANITILPEYSLTSVNGSYDGDATITGPGWAAAVAGLKPSARWAVSGVDRRLNQWQIYNINNGNSITLTKMKVSWTGGGLARITEIRLNNTAVWTGTGTTGTNFDITDTAIANGGFIGGTNTWIQWNNSGPTDPVTVTAQFTFSGDSTTTDGTSSEVVLWDGAWNGAGLPTKKLFNVVATGQVNQTNRAFKVLKTVKATVSASPGASAFEIVDWDEGAKNIP